MHLSNYKTRTDMIAQQLIETFNGATIDGLSIGKLYFDRLGQSDARSERAGQLPFKGRWIVFAAEVV